MVLLIRVDEYNIGLAHFFLLFVVLCYKAAKGRAVTLGPSGRRTSPGMHYVSRHCCALHVFLEYLNGRGHGRARRSR